MFFAFFIVALAVTARILPVQSADEFLVNATRDWFAELCEDRDDERFSRVVGPALRAEMIDLVNSARGRALTPAEDEFFCASVFRFLRWLVLRVCVRYAWDDAEICTLCCGKPEALKAQEHYASLDLEIRDSINAIVRVNDARVLRIIVDRLLQLPINIINIKAWPHFQLYLWDTGMRYAQNGVCDVFSQGQYQVPVATALEETEPSQLKVDRSPGEAGTSYANAEAAGSSQIEAKLCVPREQAQSPHEMWSATTLALLQGVHLAASAEAASRIALGALDNYINDMNRLYRAQLTVLYWSRRLLAGGSTVRLQMHVDWKLSNCFDDVFRKTLPNQTLTLAASHYMIDVAVILHYIRFLTDRVNAYYCSPHGDHCRAELAKNFPLIYVRDVRAVRQSVQLSEMVGRFLSVLRCLFEANVWMRALFERLYEQPFRAAYTTSSELVSIRMEYGQANSYAADADESDANRMVDS